MAAIGKSTDFPLTDLSPVLVCLYRLQPKPLVAAPVKPMPKDKAAAASSRITSHPLGKEEIAERRAKAAAAAEARMKALQEASQQQQLW